MSQRNERTVVFGHVDEDKVVQTLSDQDRNAFTTGSIADGVPKFTKVEDYTTFSAEWTMQDGNIIMHFFLPADFRKTGQAAEIYWTTHFAIALDAVAQEVFQATAPRLQAKYTEELKSWWLRANKYDYILDLSGLIQKFFASLDAELEKSFSTGRTD